ncbi:MAG: tryptophan synthase alpha chain [Thermoplasmata archaeon]|nr:tryptophan synthase alpha chain [Thermoplasmata archaeon]
MSRLRAAFPKDRPGVIAYAMAGDATEAHMLAILREADALEIGVPYSDPVADGPVIERAGVRALAKGVTLRDCLALAKRLRAASGKPILLMTYYNPVLQRGLARFAAEARDAGVDGVILPDAPLEESGPAGDALAAEGIDLVQLASPASPPDRLARLACATHGFLYVVSSFGVTGARQDLAPETGDLVKRVAALGVPFAVGFGVSEPRHVKALAAAGAPAVVVGSAIVGRIERGETPEQVAAYVRSLRVED